MIEVEGYQKAIYLALDMSNEIIDMYEKQQLPKRIIAKKLGVTKNTVHKTLMLLGYDGPFCFRLSVKNMKKKLTEAKKKRIRRVPILEELQ